MRSPSVCPDEGGKAVTIYGPGNLYRGVYDDQHAKTESIRAELGNSAVA